MSKRKETVVFYGTAAIAGISLFTLLLVGIGEGLGLELRIYMGITAAITAGIAFAIQWIK